MNIDLASASPEDMKPLADMMLAAPLEKRGEVTLRVQRAARDFLAKAAAGGRPSAAAETDPVRHAVFAALAKQLPAPEPVLDPLRREALGTLVKAVTAGAKANLQKGLASAIGAKLGVGRAAGMAAMRSGAKASKKAFIAREPAARTKAVDSAYARATRDMPAGAGRHGVGVKASKAMGEAWDRETPKAMRSSVRTGAMASRSNFNGRIANGKRVAGKVGLGAGIAAGGVASMMDNRRKKDA